MYPANKRESITKTIPRVVIWITIRMLLILATLLGLQMRKIDYFQAFLQSEPSEDAYIQIPAGWEFIDKDDNAEYIIKLENNIYGTVTGARNWYHKSSAGLLTRDFKQAIYDPCLFMQDELMIFVHTDACVCFSKKPETVERIITDLKQDGFLLKDKGYANELLGDIIVYDMENKTIKMTKKGLIDSILYDMGLRSSK